MGYRKANEILPAKVVALIQEYVDGEAIYIPRKPGNRVQWGSGTRIRNELWRRNQEIYEEYCKGLSPEMLAKKYFLSEKSIQRIIRGEKE